LIGPGIQLRSRRFPGRKVYDKDVAGGRADELRAQRAENVRLVAAPAADDDHVGVRLLRDPQDFGRWVADSCDGADGDSAPREEVLCLPEDLALLVALGVGGLLDSSADRLVGDDVDNGDGVAWSREVGGVRERDASGWRAVVSDDQLPRAVRCRTPPRKSSTTDLAPCRTSLIAGGLPQRRRRCSRSSQGG
jgi:hypothetical protein